MKLLKLLSLSVAISAAACNKEPAQTSNTDSNSHSNIVLAPPVETQADKRRKATYGQAVECAALASIFITTAHNSRAPKIRALEPAIAEIISNSVFDANEKGLTMGKSPETIETDVSNRREYLRLEPDRFIANGVAYNCLPVYESDRTAASYAPN